MLLTVGPVVVRAVGEVEHSGGLDGCLGEQAEAQLVVDKVLAGLVPVDLSSGLAPNLKYKYKEIRDCFHRVSKEVLSPGCIDVTLILMYVQSL